MKKCLTLLVLLLASFARAGDDPESLFREASYKETTLKDLDGAIVIYQEVVAREKEARGCAARAQFQIGVCLGKLGKGKEAAAAWQKVVEQFADQKEWADKAKERITAQAEDTDAVNADVRNRMATTKISLNFTDAPLTDVVTFLREYSRINMLIDSAVTHPEDRKITFRVEDLEFATAFDLILKMLDLRYDFEDGVVIISTEEGRAARRAAMDAQESSQPAQETEEDKAVRNTLDRTKIDLDFTDATLDDVLGFVTEYAKVKIDVSDEARKVAGVEDPVSFQMRDSRLGSVVGLLLRHYRLRYVVEKGTIRIVPSAGSK